VDERVLHQFDQCHLHDIGDRGVTHAVRDDLELGVRELHRLLPKRPDDGSKRVVLAAVPVEQLLELVDLPTLL
jgi:hypothetical protein